MSLLRFSEKSAIMLRTRCTPPVWANGASPPETTNVASTITAVRFSAAFASRNSVVADAFVRPPRSEPRAMSRPLRPVSSYSGETVPLNCTVTGPRPAVMEPSIVPSGCTAPSAAPGMHGTTRAGSLISSHTRSGAAATSKVSDTVSFAVCTISAPALDRFVPQVQELVVVLFLVVPVGGHDVQFAQRRTVLGIDRDVVPQSVVVGVLGADLHRLVRGQEMHEQSGGVRRVGGGHP